MTQAMIKGTGTRGNQVEFTITDVMTTDEGIQGVMPDNGKAIRIEGGVALAPRGKGWLTIMRDVEVETVMSDDGVTMVEDSTPDPKPVNLKPEGLNLNQLNGGKGLTRVQIAQRAVDRLEEKLVGARARLAKALSLTDES